MISEPGQVQEWKNKVLHSVVGFAAGVEKLYKEKISEASTLVPVRDNTTLMFVRNAFMDGLTGMFVVLAANSVGPSLESEEFAIKAIREKFKEYRLQQVRVPVQAR